jgi:DNA-binding CsgD family transcriptional regulator
MDDLEGFSGLIEALYDAATGNSSFWPLGPRIAAAFQSKSCVLQVRGGFGGAVERVTTTANCGPEMMDKYLSYYYQHDVWVNKAMMYPRNVILGSDDIISDSEFRESLIYRDICRLTGTFYVLGALLSIGDPHGAFGVFGVLRSEKDGLFPAEQKRRGAILVPHLKRALQLRERLRGIDIQQRAIHEALEGLAVGVMVAAENGRLLFANTVADKLLRIGNGLSVLGTRLRAAQPALDHALQRSIRDAAQASIGRAAQAGGMLTIPREERKPLGLSIYPFSAPSALSGASARVVLIFVSDPEGRPLPRREALAQMYGLTLAEARLCEALITGERLHDYAERSGVSFQTVKTQVARIFDKTGHARQTDLVREALGNLALGFQRN